MNRMWQWRWSSFPDLSKTSRFGQLGELVSCFVVILFQVVKMPAAKMEQRATDSTNDMAKRTTRFHSNHRLHRCKGVRFKDYLGNIHFMHQDNTIFQSKNFGNFRGIRGWQRFAQSHSDLPKWVANDDSNTWIWAIRTGSTVYTYFMETRRRKRPKRGTVTSLVAMWS